MPTNLHNIEPFYGWLHLYSHQADERSPFNQVVHNQFYYDRSVNRIPAHPLWDQIGSESLLVKILYASYDQHYAIIELFGEWNDLFDNDFKLLAENCLTYLMDQGINKFILVCENVFHIYPDTEDYYEALQEELDTGWICVMRAREHVLEEIAEYNLNQYLYWSPQFDELLWRKMKPVQLYRMVEDSMKLILP